MITTADIAILSDHRNIYGGIEWTLLVGPADSVDITMARDLRCGPSIREAQAEARRVLARRNMRVAWKHEVGTLRPIN